MPDKRPPAFLLIYYRSHLVLFDSSRYETVHYLYCEELEIAVRCPFSGWDWRRGTQGILSIPTKVRDGKEMLPWGHFWRRKMRSKSVISMWEDAWDAHARTRILTNSSRQQGKDFVLLFVVFLLFCLNLFLCFEIPGSWSVKFSWV